MTTAAIIQARHTSTRLPGKVVMPLAGVPVLTHIVERAKRIEGIDAVCIAVPDGPGQELKYGPSPTVLSPKNGGSPPNPCLSNSTASQKMLFNFESRHRAR